MTNELDRELTPYEMLRAEIQEFFDENLYLGFVKPFRLKELRTDELVRQVRDTRALVVFLEGIGEESLPERDREWTAKLREIGKRWEMELHLPHWYFEK